MNWYKESKIITLTDSQEHLRNVIKIIKTNDWNNLYNYINSRLMKEGYNERKIQSLINQAINIVKEEGQNELV